jgi:hypothetical protein
MSKKFLIRLIPLLVISAFVVVPTAAQANPHFYFNNLKLAAGKSKPVIAWGTITLSTNAAPAGNTLTCHNAAGGVANGTAEGVNGTGNTELFATYKCEQKKQCPKETNTVNVIPKKLPWPGELAEEGGVIRGRTTGIEVLVVCLEGEVETQKVPFVTNPAFPKCEAQAPNEKTGTSAAHPGFLEFESEGTKELEIPGSSCTLIGTTVGEVKTLGYNEQELINVKNP